MSYFHHTNVPNIIFDIHLSKLGYAELKILLIVIRQTFGWIDKKTGKPKEWDWISNQFFVKKTGLSRRAVSDGIASLYFKNYISIKNQNGTPMHTSKQRRHATKLFYSPIFIYTYANTTLKDGKYLHSTIIKHTKEYREVTTLGLSKPNFKYRKP